MLFCPDNLKTMSHAARKHVVIYQGNTKMRN